MKAVDEIIAGFEAQLKANPKANAVLLQKRIQSYIPPIASPKSLQEIQDGLNDE